MLTVIKNADVFTPAPLGIKDVLIGGSKFIALAESIDAESLSDFTEIMEADGKYLVPGFIDGHVHITGGGGEGSFKTRTPELMLSDCIQAGITSVVGVIGTDGTTRTMANLIAKAKGLKEEGISCFCQSGNYHVPIKTLTGSLENDIMLIDEIIGAGEIAIADHRSSQPSVEELARLASEARIGGILSGKGGVVNIHVGDGPGQLDLIEKVIETTDIPISQFWPTHINRSLPLLERGIEYAKKGGYVDFTTSSLDDEKGSDLKCSKGLKRMLEAGVPIEQITFTSDGQGSLPQFNKHGNFTGLGIGRVSSLFSEVKDAFMSEGLPLEQVLKTVTDNPARILKLADKGTVSEGKDADAVLIDKKTFTIDSVLARGEWLMKDSVQRVKGTFE
ncbi:beta-aspartyl-peptidase [Salipaludibacillus aurantiacus]|uniref:Isoaspartyl dipeptidase n=1 Tax=Salipaludibacillus aurantiacus TaxID=1601833 RepID=A0A1H9T8W2_9BACI|nr:beta-aspartyl-peptidase [Salipaludibacillus aurantiacus]SER93229.1 beta-aspartyl-dipeptidase (metallo-type) [Salipaludibacillus aurantiacus]